MKAHPIRRLPHLIGLLAAVCVVSVTHAQQLEPRAFSPNPVGINFISAQIGRTDGNVFVDESSPVQDFQIDFYSYILAYLRTFSLTGRAASIGVGVPYLDADASGLVFGVPTRVSRIGLGDIRVRFTLNLLADSAHDARAFARAPPDHTLGVSFVVMAPTGQYLDDKLVNIGSNRWAFKPEIGGAKTFGRWDIDGSLGVWFYTNNNDYLSGLVRSQDPIFAAQAHVSYSFAPRLWVGLSFTQYNGGRTSINGKQNDDKQNNSRAGVTLALPVARQQSLKLDWSTGTTTRAGGQYRSFNLAWQYFWANR